MGNNGKNSDNGRAARHARIKLILSHLPHLPRRLRTLPRTGPAYSVLTERQWKDICGTPTTYALNYRTHQLYEDEAAARR